MLLSLILLACSREGGEQQVNGEPVLTEDRTKMVLDVLGDWVHEAPDLVESNVWIHWGTSGPSPGQSAAVQSLGFTQILEERPGPEDSGYLLIDSDWLLVDGEVVVNFVLGGVMGSTTPYTFRRNSSEWTFWVGDSSGSLCWPGFEEFAPDDDDDEIQE